MELDDIYRKSYDDKYTELKTPFDVFFTNAVDKKYAVEQYFPLLLVPLFSATGPKYNKVLLDHYDHVYKLGAPVSTFVKSIPEIKAKYLKEEKEFRANHKYKLRIKLKWYKKIIPIGFSMNFKGSGNT